jgi:hypothetical protein
LASRSPSFCRVLSCLFVLSTFTCHAC